METALKISGLTVSYPIGYGKEKVILDNLSLEIKKGETFGLLGPNGAGKTTLIKSIVGLINIKSGVVSICEESGFASATKAKVGYMPETANYYWFMTPLEILRIFGKICGIGKGVLDKKIDDILELVGIAKHKNELVKTFSKGMQARLNIAQAILHDPELLILDEPFSGLDPLGRIHMRDILRKMKGQNKTILLSSHELSEAELICDNVCVMKEGKVLKRGPLNELLGEKGGHSLENYFISIIGKDYE